MKLEETIRCIGYNAKLHLLQLIIVVGKINTTFINFHVVLHTTAQKNCFICNAKKVDNKLLKKLHSVC